MKAEEWQNLPGDLWLHDPAIRRVKGWIENSGGRVRAVSFDFFDTLVWRWTEHPVDVFTEVGERLAARGLLPGHLCPSDYQAYRRMAEVRVRNRLPGRAGGLEDITLREITEELRALGMPLETLAAEEVAAEADLCCLNPAVVQFARWLRGRGLRVFIVSDVYLSAEHLAEILRANGCDPALFHRIYTSADQRVCKSTGNLFRAVLRAEGLRAEELVHLGDNVRADVAGAWRAGVRAVGYAPVWQPAQAIFEREGFLPGRPPTVFSSRWLRLLATRRFGGGDDAAFFGRAGALLMGPVLSGFVTWACEELARAGVRRVGAFMREGALLGRMLQREAGARGWELEVRPLYVNRTSTDLAALGRLTAEKLVDWLGRRQTLSVRAICEQLGLEARDLRRLPLDPEERLETPDRMLEFARWLFQPEVARRVETRSAEERRKVLDYLRPWFEGIETLGVCDIGYNATAQYQIHEILRLEGNPRRTLGCYVLTCETAAARALEGMDVRSYLGSFGSPRALLWAFLRSPAFAEQLIIAPCGSTVGYRRNGEGTVEACLSDTPLPPSLVERQRWFQEGVLWYQTLWLWVRGSKGWLGTNRPDWLRRWETDLRRCDAAILARAAAFPLPEEVEQFGGLILDDRYFEGGVRRLCSDRDLTLLRDQGYAGLLQQQGVLWPQAVFHKHQPKAANEYFAFGRAMLLGELEGRTVHEPVELLVFIPADAPDASCAHAVRQVRAAWPDVARTKVVLLGGNHRQPPGPQLRGALQGIRYVWISAASNDPWLVSVLVQACESDAPWLAWLQPGVELPERAWEQMMRATEGGRVGAAVPGWADLADPDRLGTAQLLKVLPRCLLLRRDALLDGLPAGMKESAPGRVWAGWLSRIEAAGWEVRCVREVRAQVDGAFTARDSAGCCPEGNTSIPGVTLVQLRRWLYGHAADMHVRTREAEIGRNAPGPVSHHPEPVRVNWVGSFLDHGSLSHVNRELTRALEEKEGIRVHRVQQGRLIDSAYARLAQKVSSETDAGAPVTVRHAWPPDWRRPRSGRFVVIQPWEFGALPVDWVRASERVDEFWVPSRYVRQVYVDSGIPAEKVVVVPNGVDTERFRPDAPARSLPTSKRFRFLFVGGTIVRKGPDVLLRAYVEAFRAVDDVCLVIKDCGGATHYAGQTLADRIRSLQQQPGAPEILYLDEEWPPDQLPGLYTACHCLVLPYRGEGFGLPVLEAMACGLPVIVTAGGATDDFVDDDCGWRIPAERRGIGDRVGEFRLVRPGWWLEPDADALAGLFRAAYEDPEGCRERGRRACERARDYTWTRVAGQVAARLRQVAGQAEKTTAAPDSVGRGRVQAVTPRIALPACARLGHLGRARELAGQRRWEQAWKAALAAMEERPFHPEAWLLLAEIARSVGAGKVARQCAERSRQMAPGYTAARQFLKRSFHGSSRPDWMQLPEHDATTARPRLSVGLIVRNEEAFLGGCLASVREVADQIVVVDTGSTDRTVEIARSYGAEVYEFTWCDDFSAARNAVLEHVRGDWVLMLDADEELTEEGRRELAAALERPEVMAWRLPIVDVGREEEGVSYVPRLFRNAPGLFYVGRVHEQVFSSVEVRRREWGLDCRIGKVLLRHHGYRPEVIRDRNKIERNLRLLEQAVEELPGEPHLLMNLGLELVRAGREAEGLERYRQAFAAMSRKPAGEVVPELRETLLTQMASRLLGARRYEEVIEVLTSPLARGHGGLTASLHFALGLAHLERGQFSEAADQMRQCLAKRDRPTLSPILKEIRTAAPHHCLAVALWRSGDAEGAEQSFQTALQGPGSMDRIRLDYARFLVERERPVDALRALTECVTEKPDCVEAWRLGGQVALSRPDFLEFARDWTGEALRYVSADTVLRVQRATALLLSGDCEGAWELWRQAEGVSSHPETVAARLLCAAVTGRAMEPWDASIPEPAVSRAWLGWYQRLHRCGAHKVLVQLHDSLPGWAERLPTAARCLQAALEEARQTAAAGAG
mgnify:CR=1 FL=1